MQQNADFACEILFCIDTGVMLKRVLENLEGVDESLRGLYVEQTDGSFRLDAEPDDGAELKQALERSRTEARQLKAKLARFEGIDPDEHQRLADRVGELEALKGKNDGEFEKLKDQLAEKYSGELERLKNETNKLTNQLHTRELEVAASAAIAKHKGVPELLMPFIRERAKVVGENGEAVVRIFDEKGNERISPRSGIDAPMSVDELVEEMKSGEQFARLFDGSGGSGGGASQGGVGGANAAKRRSEMTYAEKAAYVSANGEEAYARLPA